MITYRAPTLADIAEIAALHVLCWQQAYAGIFPDDFLRDLSVQKRAEGWHRSLADDEVISVIACDGEKVVGFVSAGPVRDEHGNMAAISDGEIYAIYNHADYYRLGIGRALVAQVAAQWMARSGRSLLVLFVAQNLRAEAFYRSLGGKPAYRGPLKIAGIEVDDVGYVFSDLAALIPLPSHG
jgi:ribosomal protein S18 acetylase RimI-like enzyme